MSKYRDINRANITGNLTDDPVERYTTSGKCVVNLKVAVNRGTNRNGDDQGADFIPVTVWDKAAEACAKYLKKGSKVAVEGNIKTSTYEKDGQRRYKTEINAQQVLFLSTPARQDSNDYPTEHMQEKANGYAPEPDPEAGPGNGGEEIDIPF